MPRSASVTRRWSLALLPCACARCRSAGRSNRATTWRTSPFVRSIARFASSHGSPGHRGPARSSAVPSRRMPRSTCPRGPAVHAISIPARERRRPPSPRRPWSASTSSSWGPRKNWAVATSTRWTRSLATEAGQWCCSRIERRPANTGGSCRRPASRRCCSSGRSPLRLMAVSVSGARNSSWRTGERCSPPRLTPAGCDPWSCRGLEEPALSCFPARWTRGGFAARPAIRSGGSGPAWSRASRSRRRHRCFCRSSRRMRRQATWSPFARGIAPPNFLARMARRSCRPCAARSSRVRASRLPCACGPRPRRASTRGHGRPLVPDDFDVRVSGGDGLVADAPLVIAADARTRRLDPSSEWLASATGGVAAHASDTARVETFLRQLPQPSAPAQVHPMRSGWWIVPFAVALCAEWALRRRKGLR